MIDNLYSTITRRPAVDPASAAGDRLLRRCLASSDMGVRNAALRNMAVTAAARDEFRSFVDSDVSLVSSWCCRADCTVAELERYLDVLSSDAVEHLARYTRSADIIDYAVAHIAIDCVWESVVENFEAPAAVVAATLDAYPRLAARFVSSALSAHLGRVMRLCGDTAARAIVAAGAAPGSVGGVVAVADRFGLCDPDTYCSEEGAAAALELVEVLFDGRINAPAPPVMVDIRAAARAGVPASHPVMRRLNEWIRTFGVDRTSGLGDAGLAALVASTTSAVELASLFDDVVRQFDSDDPVPETVSAAWCHPRRGDVDVRGAVAAFFSGLDSGVHTDALTELAASELDAEVFAVYLNALRGSGDDRAAAAMLSAATLSAAELSERARALWSAASDAETARRFASLCGWFACADCNAVTLAHVPFENLVVVANTVSVVEALDELLGGSDAAWEAFEVLSGRDATTVGDACELARLATTDLVHLG